MASCCGCDNDDGNHGRQNNYQSEEGNENIQYSESLFYFLFNMMNNIYIFVTYKRLVKY